MFITQKLLVNGQLEKKIYFREECFFLSECLIQQWIDSQPCSPQVVNKLLVSYFGKNPDDAFFSHSFHLDKVQ